MEKVVRFALLKRGRRERDVGCPGRAGDGGKRPADQETVHSEDCNVQRLPPPSEEDLTQLRGFELASESNLVARVSEAATGRGDTAGDQFLPLAFTVRRLDRFLSLSVQMLEGLGKDKTSHASIYLQLGSADHVRT